ncbi:MAG: hypothetical protein NXI10_04985 [bacterium]|nr:hypothetical protein [bacterium]
MDFAIRNVSQFDLKPKELEILYLSMEGRFIQDIANRLDISTLAALNRQEELMKSWGCSTLIGMVVESFNRGHLNAFKELHEKVIRDHRRNIYLSETERRYLQLMVYDLTIEEIAEILKKKERRMKEIHVGIIHKFGIRNDMQLLAIALQNRLISIPVSIGLIK